MTAVYYFSGTGNSIAVAKDIASEMGCTAVPMAWGNSSSDADKIGLVFPVYMAQLYGLPLIVERFINGMKGIGSKYIFAVCTCGGLENFNGLPALRNLAKLVRQRGGRVHAEFVIRLPMNTLDYSHIPVPIDQDQNRMMQNCARKVQEIRKTVARGGKSKHKRSKILLNRLMTPLYLMLHSIYYKELRKNAKVPSDRSLGFRQLVPLTDKSIYTNEKCRSCSTCARVCPVGNIRMVDGRPTWQHRCEICLACVEWCPNMAIHHASRPAQGTYRHPRVTLSDMIEQAKESQWNSRSRLAWQIASKAGRPTK